MKFFTFVFLSLASITSFAWEPTKPITAYIGYAPGSGNEIAFRGVASAIEKKHPNVRFVVLNMPGADNIVATNQVAKLNPDGYNLIVTSEVQTYALADIFTPELLQYKTDDLRPILTLGSSPQVMVTHPDNPVSNVKQLVAQLKNPSKPINVGLSGTTPFMLYAGLMEYGQGDYKKVSTVMYKGPAQIMGDVVNRGVDYGILPMSVAAQLVLGGKLKFVGIAADTPIPQFKDVQLFKDVLPNLVVPGQWNITLQKGTPADVVAWYVKVFNEAIASPEVAQYYHANFIQFNAAKNPDESGKQIAKLRARFAPLALQTRKYYFQ